MRSCLFAQHATFSVRDSQERVEVYLRGEFDLLGSETSSQMINHVARLIANRARPVIVDLSGVSFLDAAGIRVIEQLDRIADLASSTMLLANTPLHVCRLLELVGRDDLLKRT